MIFVTGLKMVKLHELKDDDYVIKKGDCVSVEELKENWEYMTFEQRQDWYTTNCKRLKITAKEVIDYVVDKFYQEGYDEIDFYILERISKEQENDLQKVLDDLFDNRTADVYYPAEEIEVE